MTDQMTPSILDLLESLDKERSQHEWSAGRSDVMSYDAITGIGFKNIYLPEDSDGNLCLIKVITSNPIADSQFIAASANHLPSVVKGMRIAIKALEAECCCTGEHKYEGSHELIKCDACEALSEIQKLVGGG